MPNKVIARCRVGHANLGALKETTPVEERCIRVQFFCQLAIRRFRRRVRCMMHRGVGGVSLGSNDSRVRNHPTNPLIGDPVDFPSAERH